MVERKHQQPEQPTTTVKDNLIEQIKGN